uniref:Uncharacterized protein n=1 Tax=Acrobeloides nanus TaxID=290746 RepID=A0A914E9T5_9BILA
MEKIFLSVLLSLIASISCANIQLQGSQGGESSNAQKDRLTNSEDVPTLNFNNFMKSYLHNRMDTISENGQPQYVAPEIEESEEIPLEALQPNSFQPLLPYYLVESENLPIKQDKRSFQFYGARGKKSVYTTQDKRFSYLPSRGRR